MDDVIKAFEDSPAQRYRRATSDARREMFSGRSNLRLLRLHVAECVKYAPNEVELRHWQAIMRHIHQGKRFRAATYPATFTVPPDPQLVDEIEAAMGHHRGDRK